MYRKIVLHLQRCIFANYTNCCFFTVLRRCLRRLALHHFIFGLNYKYYRALRFLPWLNLYIIQVIQLCLGKRQYLPDIDQLCGSGLIIFIRGGSAPRSNALTFHYHIYYFWQKRYPFRIPFYWQMVPISHSYSLGRYIALNCCKCTVLKGTDSRFSACSFIKMLFFCRDMLYRLCKQYDHVILLSKNQSTLSPGSHLHLINLSICK